MLYLAIGCPFRENRPELPAHQSIPYGHMVVYTRIPMAGQYVNEEEIQYNFSREFFKSLLFDNIKRHLVYDSDSGCELSINKLPAVKHHSGGSAIFTYPS
jgi:hypothetical protein